MILRTATSATAQHDMPAHETDLQGGFVQVRPTSLIDRPTIELRWDGVPHAVVVAVRQHWDQYGQRGIPFDPVTLPAVTLPEGHYSYDSALSIQRTNASQHSMRTTAVRSLAYD